MWKLFGFIRRFVCIPSIQGHTEVDLLYIQSAGLLCSPVLGPASGQLSLMLLLLLQHGNSF
jgi:hypothetical protein